MMLDHFDSRLRKELQALIPNLAVRWEILT